MSIDDSQKDSRVSTTRLKTTNHVNSTIWDDM
jgi:hypothetical protein